VPVRKFLKAGVLGLDQEDEGKMVAEYIRRHGHKSLIRGQVSKYVLTPVKNLNK